MEAAESILALVQPMIGAKAVDDIRRAGGGDAHLGLVTVLTRGLQGSPMPRSTDPGQRLVQIEPAERLLKLWQEHFGSYWRRSSDVVDLIATDDQFAAAWLCAFPDWPAGGNAYQVGWFLRRARSATKDAPLSLRHAGSRGWQLIRRRGA